MFMGGMRTVSKCDLLKRYTRCDRWDEVAKYLRYGDKNVILVEMLMRPYKKQYCRNIWPWYAVKVLQLVNQLINCSGIWLTCSKNVVIQACKTKGRRECSCWWSWKRWISPKNKYSKSVSSCKEFLCFERLSVGKGVWMQPLTVWYHIACRYGICHCTSCLLLLPLKNCWSSCRSPLKLLCWVLWKLFGPPEALT